MSKNEIPIDFTQPYDIHCLENLLVCPLCQARLDFFPDAIACSSCAHQFRQVKQGCIDLLPSGAISPRSWIGQYLTSELQKISSTSPFFFSNSH